MLVGRQLGPFAVEKILGSGAMGTVYLGRYTKNNQPVAIKVVTAGLDANPNTIARFEREAAILKSLNHPNIVRLYGSGTYHKAPFYVMEYVEGETLESVLLRRGRFSWEAVVGLGQQISAALQHAHDQGVIHRDLKPTNLMMTADDTVKLMDFGIAKGLELSQLTATNCAIGTAAYMSPEQCRGERDLTPKSDLYSLGVVLYQLLTGRLPFTAASTLDMFLAHTKERAPAPVDLVTEIPADLNHLVLALLKKDPRKRPENGAAVARTLTETLDNELARKSALAEKAKTTLGGPPIRLNQSQREATRLLGTATTKVTKRNMVPLHERGWVPLAGIAAVLLAVTGIIYAAARPPGAHGLYVKAQRLMESQNADDWTQAREGPLRAYLRYYPTRDDDEAVRMRGWADQVDLQQRERQLQNRMKLNFPPEAEEERTAFAAVRAENAGELATARARWQSIETLKDSPDEELRPWGLVAHKRLGELKEIEQREQQLRQAIMEARTRRLEYKPTTELEQLPAQAMRYELFGDLAAALKRWKDFKQNHQDEPGQRLWLLLASKKIHDLIADAPSEREEKEFRLKLVRDKLADAERMRNDDPEAARDLCRDILILYEKTAEGDMKDAISQAKKLLGAIAADNPPKAGASSPPP